MDILKITYILVDHHVTSHTVSHPPLLQEPAGNAVFHWDPGCFHRSRAASIGSLWLLQEVERVWEQGGFYADSSGGRPPVSSPGLHLAVEIAGQPSFPPEALHG